MASNYNRRAAAARKCMVENGRRRRDPPPADASTTCWRWRSDRCRASSIAFEGLDQSGKQTQAEALRDHLAADGPRLPAAVVSRLRRRTSATEIADALHGERDYAPDVMQLLYVANRYEKQAAIERWLAEGVVVHLRSLPRVEHRLRRGAGLDAAWLTRDPEVPAAARSDDPARHRAGDRGRRKAAGRDRYERDLDAAVARARELPPPGGRGGLAPAGRRARQGRGRRPTSFTRSRDTARAAVSARTSRAPASRSTRAHASASRRSCSHRPPAPRAARRRRTRRRRSANAPRTLRVALRRRQVRLRRRRAACGAAHRAPAAEMPRQLARLVEAARPLAGRCSGTGTTTSAPASRSAARCAQCDAPRPRASDRQPSYLSAWTIARSDPS